MNEHGWLKLAMENVKDTKAALTLQIRVVTGNVTSRLGLHSKGFNPSDIYSSDKKS